MDKKLKKIWKQLIRDGAPYRSPNASNKRLDEVHYNINERAYYRDVLDRCLVDGKIGVGRSGRDCDCTQYSREYVTDMPNSAFLFAKEEREHEEWLDGPESTRFMRPDKVEPHHRSLDLALRAYEDGHPHRVETVGFHELIAH